MSETANFFNIDRLRIETDGRGVRSLVCFSGCPLKCKYCPNRRDINRAHLILTPEGLRDRLAIDDIYFKASSVGGVTFGGGEPALHGEYIEGFRQLCPPEWTLFIETSLNVPQEQIERLANVIDHWYIDIKDMNPEIYRKYTGVSNQQVINNLRFLIGVGLADKITVRVPLIPGYNTEEDVEKSLSALQELGVVSTQSLTYYVDYTPDRETTMRKPTMGVPIEPKPPKFRKYLYLFAWIIANGIGVLCYIFMPSKAITLIGAIFIGILVAAILCLAINLLFSTRRSFDDEL